MALSVQTTRRLAFIKVLHQLAIQHSAVSPIAGTALLGLHDALEMFLLLGCEHLRVDPGKRAGFEDYWGTLNKALEPSSLPLTVAMRRMNTARVNLKHHGLLPSTSDFEDFRHNLETFFNEATTLLFRMEYGEVSMIDVVEPEGARQALVEMRAALASNDKHRAVGCIGVAFEQVIDHHEQSAVTNRWTRFNFNRNLSTSFINKKGRNDELLVEVTDSLKPVQRALEVMALGLDLAGYTRLAAWAPAPMRTGDGKYHRNFGGGWGGHEPTQSYFDFCERYIIECSIRLASQGHPQDAQLAPEAAIRGS